MHRVILPLFLLLVTYANAQTLMPARQVSVDTDAWIRIDPLFPSAQEALNWLDENFPDLSSLGPWESTDPFFNPLSVDLGNLYSYLLGGPYYLYDAVTNTVDGVNTYVFTRKADPELVFSSSPDGAAPRALVPELQRSQNITETNFSFVNVNTEIMKQLFMVAGAQYFGFFEDDEVVEEEDPRYQDYLWFLEYKAQVDEFLEMNLEYGELPTQFELFFPSVLRMSLDGIVDTVIPEAVATRFHEIEIDDGRAWVDWRNGKHQTLTIDQNVEVLFVSPPAEEFTELNVWYQQTDHTAYTVTWSSVNVSYDPSPSVDLNATNGVALARYFNGPWETFWREAYVLPSSDGVVSPEGPVVKSITATGGAMTTFTNGAVTYQVHTFTSSGSLSVSSADPGALVDVMVVGGGGGGTGAEYLSGTWARGGAGGGGGAVVFSYNVPIAAMNYAVTVGGGGAGGAAGNPLTKGTPGKGRSSSVLGVTAEGGGRAGIGPSSGGAGGCGGGAMGWAQEGGHGTVGKRGGNGALSSGGGGGGMSTAGAHASAKVVPGAGGQGITTMFSGTSMVLGSGGGGGSGKTHQGQPGASGGTNAGSGGVDGNTNAGDGTANRGGGGGGASILGPNWPAIGKPTTPRGGNGGSGLVVVRYVIDIE